MSYELILDFFGRVKMVSIAVVWFFLVCSASVAQFGPSAPLHDAGPEIHSTAEYTLYLHYDRPCRKDVPYPRARTSLAFKSPSFVVPEDDEFKETFLEELLPHIRRACPGNMNVNVDFYIEGYRLGSLDDDISNSPEALKKGGLGATSFGAAHADFNDVGQLTKFYLTGWRSVQARKEARIAARLSSEEREAARIAKANAKWKFENRYFDRDEFGRDVLVCNSGDIDIAVAVLKTSRPASSPQNNSWTYRSWKLIKMNNCAGVSFGNVYSHLVVALIDHDYRFGVVRYSVESSSAGLSAAAKYQTICVTDKTVKDSGQGYPQKYVPPCPPGYFAAPTSATSLIREWGGGDAQMTIRVAPSKTDRVVVAFSDGKETNW